MNRCLLPFIVLICSYSIAQEDIDTTLVRLQKELRNAATDSLRINAQLALSEYQYDRDFSIAKQLVEDALVLIKSNLRTSTIIQFYGFNIKEQLPENVSTKQIEVSALMEKKIQTLGINKNK